MDREPPVYVLPSPPGDPTAPKAYETLLYDSAQIIAHLV